MRTNLAGDRQIIRLWPAEVYSRGDRSRLPFRRIWQSTQSNFPPCSQPSISGQFKEYFRGSLLVVAYEMLKHKGHYRELGADFFDGLNKDQVKRRLVQRLAKLGFQVTVTKAPTAE